MGILSENLTWLLRNVQPPCSMLELGDQFLYITVPPWPGYPPKHLNPTMVAPIAAKPMFEELGFEHVSIDLNGEHGALPLDLDKPIDLGRQFDVVTDFGTSEHVLDLFACMENVHRHLKPGGKLVHVNPKPGNWPGHGNWYRDQEFYRRFAAGWGYSILEMFETAACGNTTDGWNVACLMTKATTGDAPWISRETFDTFGVKPR